MEEAQAKGQPGDPGMAPPLPAVNDKENVDEKSPPRPLNALEESRRTLKLRENPLSLIMKGVLSTIPGIRSLFDLKKEKLNYEPRRLFFNTPIPDELLDHRSGYPKAKYATNKIRTTKYTPLNFLPKNIAFQFQNVANIYFLVVAILSGFSIFGVSNAGLAAVPIIAIVVITAIRDGVEDWRRQLIDLDVNNTITVVLANVSNDNSSPDNISAWRRFKKACSRFYRKTWLRMRHKPDPLELDEVDDNENQSIRESMGDIGLRRSEAASRSSLPTHHSVFNNPENYPPSQPRRSSAGTHSVVNFPETMPSRRSSAGLNSLKSHQNSHQNSRPSSTLGLATSGTVNDLGALPMPPTPHAPQGQRPRSGSLASVRRIFTSRSAAAAHLEKQPAFKRTYWKNVRVGDFIKIYADQGVPADVAIISTSDPEGDCFIDTRNLDGETSLKPRRALQMTSKLRRGWQINKLSFEMEVEGANSDLTSFGWTFRDMSSGKAEPIGPPNFLPRGATVRNTRWVIGYVVYTGGESKIVLNAGETPTKRSRMARDLNVYVAASFIFLFLLCLISGVVEGVKFRKKDNIAYFFDGGLMTNNPPLNGFVTFFAAMLVLQNLVPISLYISIEIVRTFFAIFIYSDYYMYDEETDYPATPKSWALSDDLGQIEFIFSDKTGTLTQNNMVFRKCTVNGKSYGTAFTESMAGQVKRRGGDVDAIRAEANAQINAERERMLLRLNDFYANPYFDDDTLELVSEPIVADLQGASGAAQQQRIEQFALALALCNTVVTEIVDAGSKGVGLPASNRRHGHNKSASRVNFPDAEIADLPMPRKIQSSTVFGAPVGRNSVSSTKSRRSIDHTRTVVPTKESMQGKTLVHKAESPDESSLVKMARDLGYTLVDEDKRHKVVDMRGTFHTFEILQTILFTSQRKRMSILVKNEADRYFLLTKGADQVIEKRLSSEWRDSETFSRTEKYLEQYGDEGLRTLMIGYRELDARYALDWSKRFHDASASPERDTLTEMLADEIEQNIVLLGGTGIEDQLQEDVPNTIEVLGRAGIKLWMLTGDKVETAISIGFSCNLLDTSMELLIVKSPEELKQHLDTLGIEVNKKTLREAGRDHRPAQGKHALVIDGSALQQVVSHPDYKLQFALLGKKCKSVLCCRVSPSQKAAVVHIMKSTFDVMSIAIGDGANDVSMIQVADVGIGIVGVEGRQAAMSADFAIGQFRFLQRLILVHGRYAYMRVAGMTGSLLFENFMFSMTLFWYGIYNQFDQSYLYDYTYLTLFNSVFVSLPPVVRGIFDQDLPPEVLLANPELYGRGIRRQLWNKTTYLCCVFDGIYQSAVTFFFGYSVFFTGKFYAMSGRDIAYRQGLGVLIGHSAVFSCNTYVLLGQYRWDWISMLVYIVSCMLIFAWTGIYSSAVPSNFFYGSAAHIYSTLTFWAYFLVATIAALIPSFVRDTVKRIWFPEDVDVIREEAHFPKLVAPSRLRQTEKAEKPVPGTEPPASEEPYAGRNGLEEEEEAGDEDDNSMTPTFQ